MEATATDILISGQATRAGIKAIPMIPQKLLQMCATQDMKRMELSCTNDPAGTLPRLTIGVARCQH